MDKKLLDLDRRVVGLESGAAAARASSEPPRKAARIGGPRASSVPPMATASSGFSDDTIECNGWPATTLRDNIKDDLKRILKDADAENSFRIVVLRKYGDRALLRCDDHAAGVRLLDWWREHAPKYKSMANQEHIIYARWRPTRERAFDEWLLRTAFKHMQRLGIQNIEKEKGPLVIYAGAKPAVRVVRGQLQATFSWPTDVTFNTLLEAVEKDRL